MFICYVFLFFLINTVSAFSDNNTVVFRRGEGGYACIRIPALLTTIRGNLLAFGEARLFNCGDETRKDLVYKRSTDNGQTWSELKILVRANVSSENSVDYVGNLPPVQLKYNQRILMVFCKNNHMIMQSYSDDDGLTFSKPELITNVTKPEWKWVGTGPPGGLLLQSNRILIPGHYSTNASSIGGSSVGFVMLNDHNGQVDKWYLGGEYNLDDYAPSEAQAVELLPNINSVFINARSYSTKRIGAYSSDGGLTFSKVKILNTLVQPPGGCEGSSLYHQSTRRLFYSGLAVNVTQRTHLSLYVSKDEGENWSFIETIWSGPSAYSSLTTLTDQSIGILFEAGTKESYESVLFTRINR